MGFSPHDPFHDPMFDFVTILIIIISLIIFGFLIVSIFQGIQQRNRDNQSPILDVGALIVAKRTEVHSYQHHNNDSHHVDHTSRTTYYVTFEVQSKDRLEFVVSGVEFGQLAEGDTGKLTFQGSRYLGFERYS